jgi:nitric oxide reductase NorE protein
MRARLLALVPRGRDLEVAGGMNMWLFVVGELAIFAFYFFVFMMYRTHDTESFVASQHHLNLAVGTFNTVVLLTSSYFVALAVQAGRAGSVERARRLLRWTIVLAIAFTAIKLGEWAYEVGHGYTFVSDDFFMFYFGFTGVHLFHVLLGVGVLSLVLRELGPDGSQRQFVVESGATYWHMVDVVWIVLFALLYVLR